jgi:hypothetical protein
LLSSVAENFLPSSPPFCLGFYVFRILNLTLLPLFPQLSIKLPIFDIFNIGVIASLVYESLGLVVESGCGKIMTDRARSTRS